MGSWTYKPEFAETARLLVGKHGLIVRELAEVFHVVRTTIYAWMRDFPEFKQAVDDGREDAKDMLRASMFRRATGYEYWEEEWQLRSRRKNAKPQLVKKWKRHLPADKTMMIYLSQNWMPGEYKDRQQFDHHFHIPPSVINIMTPASQRNDGSPNAQSGAVPETAIGAADTQ